MSIKMRKKKSFLEHDFLLSETYQFCHQSSCFLDNSDVKSDSEVVQKKEL